MANTNSQPQLPGGVLPSRSSRDEIQVPHNQIHQEEPQHKLLCNTLIEAGQQSLPPDWKACRNPASKSRAPFELGDPTRSTVITAITFIGESQRGHSRGGHRAVRRCDAQPS